MRQWLPALRMARRDLRRHKVRALLTCILVALPVVVATVAALGSYNSRWDAEQEARAAMGLADASVTVSPFAAVRSRLALWGEARPAELTSTPDGRVPVRRDPAEVDLATLLPPGSRIVPDVEPGTVPLATGGTAQVLFADLSSPMTSPYVTIDAGRPPTRADEVAVPEIVADELGMLDDGELRDSARLQLADGVSVAVVGLAESSPSDGRELTLVAPLDSTLRSDGDRPSYRFLVDLPELSRPELKELAGMLSASGVVFQPRDAVLEPRAWGLESYESIDVEPLVVAGFVILVGLLEVVLLVGAAFAVAARRQVRDLGLLSANGGTAPDVRRVLLAQGLVLGTGSSVVGVLLGVLAFRQLTPLWETLFDSEMWRDEIDWRAIVLILVLGSLTSVVAALLPAWTIARLTPVAALSGRFPVRPGEARAHRGAFVLAAAGLALLALGGWATARTFGPRGSMLTLAPFLAGVGLLLLVAGVIWATPYVVRRLAAAGAGLSLSGRFAFRDAARHRFRTAAAAMTLIVTVGGGTLAAFGFSSAAHPPQGDWQLPPHSADLIVDHPVTPERVDRMRETVASVLGPVELQVARSLTVRGHRHGTVGLGRRGYEVVTVDEETLQRHFGTETPLRAFRDGAVVQEGAVSTGTSTRAATLVARGNRGQVMERFDVQVVEAPPDHPATRLGRVFVSAERAAELGLVTTYAQVIATAERPVTDEDLDRLAVRGIVGWSEDPDRLLADRMQFAGLGIAGLLSVLVVGVAVAMTAAESRDDVATLAAIGAGPWRRRAFGAMHGLFLGLVGGLLGVLVGLPGGMALTQVDGRAGVDVPWLASFGTVAVVLAAAPVVGWLVTPSRLRLTRRGT